jgi:CheY-like chemotaxis protein
LVVDDEPIVQYIISECLADEGYALQMEADGDAAWTTLTTKGKEIDVIILDRVMPGLDGLELLKRIKATADFRHLPVIMQTAMSRPEDVREGLEAGAHYYLTKPFDPRALLTIVKAAVEDAESSKAKAATHEDFLRSLRTLTCAEYEFTTLEDARVLAYLLSLACPTPPLAAMGFTELLINAIEHGNLGISYDEKKDLRNSGLWEAEIERRLQHPEYSDRKAHLRLERLPHMLRFTITDQGKGFDWQRYMDFDPERAFDPNGRGIAMARQMSFSRLQYQGDGNILVAEVDLPTDQ